MSERIIEIEADSLEEARRKLYNDDLIVLEEIILCYERVETIECVGETVTEAAMEARGRIPVGANIEKREVKIPPKRSTLKIEVNNKGLVEPAYVPKVHEVVGSITLYRKGRRGFLGIGKRPDIYEIALLQKAVVEVIFREQARIRARVKGYLGKDLLLVIQGLRKQNTRLEDIYQPLNPKEDAQVRISLNAILDPDLYDIHTALNFLEEACLANEELNWQAVIQEAYKKAADARMQLWVELRGLDAEVANAYMLYTSIDWHEKNYQEPTGIPMHTRQSYGNHPPNPTKRQTIPRYSTDIEAFSELEKRVDGFGVYERYRQILQEDGYDEATATLRQKCSAMLKAQKPQKEREV